MDQTWRRLGPATLDRIGKPATILVPHIRNSQSIEAEFAWPKSDRPGRLDFAYAPVEAVRTAIQEALGAAFPPARDPEVRLAGLRPSSDPAGRYRLTTRDGIWFIRVSARWGAPELETAVVEHLIGEGVSVCRVLVAGVPLHWREDTYRIDVRPLIQGRHFDGSRRDLEAVAALLSRCHSALSRFPRREEVRTAAALRNRRVADMRDRLAEWLRAGSYDHFGEHAAWASAHRPWFERMIDEFDPLVDRWPEAQCLHGEIHRGNVLFDMPDGVPVLVDLEEAVHLLAPPVWDLAFLIQRFCLTDNPSHGALAERVSCVSAAYGSPLPKLAGTMRQIAWFNMALLLDSWLTSRIATPLAEYGKFVALEQQAAAYQHVL